MRLVLLDQFSDLGGAQQGLLELLPGIRRRGWQAVVGIPGEGELFARVRELGFSAERVECGPYHSGNKSAMDLFRFLTGTPMLARQIRRLTQQIDADLVYVNGPRLLPGVALAGLHAPVLFHSHSYLFPGPMRHITGAALRRSRAGVIGSCRFVGDSWSDYVSEDRISVIYNGVPGPARIPDHTAAGLAIGCIGRIAPEKGQLDFLKTAAVIHQALPECRFLIYGAALFGEARALRYEEEVRAAAGDLPVEFRGWVGNIYEALAQLDLLLVPSQSHEATTRVILEAFAAGVPVIAFRSGGIPEVVDHGVDGLLTNSAAEMAAFAIDLLGDRKRRLQMSRAARESWCARFTTEHYHQQVLDAIEKATGASERRK